MPANIIISTDQKFLRLDWIHDALVSSYWGTIISEDRIPVMIENSICFGAYLDHGTEVGAQVGFARVLSDRAVLSAVTDVIVDYDFRGQGIGTALMQAVVAHPDIACTLCILETRHADRLYEKVGFVRCGSIMKRNPTP